MNTKLHFLVTLLLFTACFSTNGQKTLSSKDLKKTSHQVILDWNVIAYDLMGGAASQNPLLSVRIHTVMHIAMHDALNAVVPVYKTYAFHEKNKMADPAAAMISAAYEALVASQPNQKAMLDERLAASLAKIPDSQAKTEGIALGKKAAAAIVTMRQNDGAFADPVGAVTAAPGPGVYQATPPMNILFAPLWLKVPTFSLTKLDQFRITPPPALSSAEYAKGFNEVKRIGQKDSPTRTAEQTAIAKFWYEYSDIGWNRIARIVATDRKLDAHGTARLFALLNMALTDAYTAGWDSKYHYNFWRPYTAIRAADIDDNPKTEADPQWEPCMPTPPVHDYPSTHSALGNAAAAVLAHVFGDKTKFTFESTTGEPTTYQRSFTSFSQAADENAESRVLAGIHFRFSCKKGQELGTKVGKWTVEQHLSAVNVK